MPPGASDGWWDYQDFYGLDLCDCCVIFIFNPDFLFFQVFTEFVTIYASILCFGFLAMWHVGSSLLTGIQPVPPALKDEV